MGDVVTVKARQNQPFKFVYKRKVYLKNLDATSEDPMFERLCYLQAVDEVVRGNIPLEGDDQAAQLAAYAMAADLVDDMDNAADGLLEQNLMSYIPANLRENMGETVRCYTPLTYTLFIPRCSPSFFTLQEWAEKVLTHRDAALDIESEEVQAKFIEGVKDHPLYGTCFFHVRKNKFPDHMDAFPEHVIIALNSEGLHFLNEVRAWPVLCTLCLPSHLPLPSFHTCRSARPSPRSATPTSTAGAAAVPSSASSSGTLSPRTRTMWPCTRAKPQTWRP
jgi:hypothetical protein